MKTMKASELRSLSVDELERKTAELRNELFDARIRRATEQLEDTASLRLRRREIARLETVLTEKREAGK
ncbi:MAG: 50S ribosomal protein L29 [Myxococcota bacterium]